MVRTNKFRSFSPPGWKRKHLWLILMAALGIVGVVTLIARRITFLPNSPTVMIPWSSIGGALVIFGLRLTDVPVGTLKTVLMVRGMRTWATLLGLLEVTVWITAMGR